MSNGADAFLVAAWVLFGLVILLGFLGLAFDALLWTGLVVAIVGLIIESNRNATLMMPWLFQSEGKK